MAKIKVPTERSTHMGHTANVSFKEEDEDVWEFLEEQHEDGPYRNRSHVVVEALKRMQDMDEEDRPIT